jgi:hypothetical protein
MRDKTKENLQLMLKIVPLCLTIITIASSLRQQHDAWIRFGIEESYRYADSRSRGDENAYLVRTSDGTYAVLWERELPSETLSMQATVHVIIEKANLTDS